MTFDVHQLDTFLLVGAGVTLLAILAVRVSTRAGLPSLLLYLLMGVALGEAGVGIHFENAEVAQALGFAALAVILAEGGLTTSWRSARLSMRIGLSLATLGVAVSVAGIGLLLGFGGAWLMRRAALPASGLYPIAVLTLAFLSYGVAAFAHASPFAAVYVAALVLGNSELPHRGATRSFAEGVAWLAQIGLFVMLGLLLSPGRISWHTVGLALLAGLILTLVARPVSVVASSVVQRMPWPDLTFLSWAGLRGAVP